MEIEVISISKLKEMKDNPRKIDEVEFENLKNSIREFGQATPLVVNKDNTVIGGHQTLKALKDLGFRKVNIIRKDLDEEKAKILNIALNKIGGEFDYEKLNKFIEEIDNISLTGFSEQEINQIQKDYDYKDVSKELEKLETEGMQNVIWVTRFKDKKEFQEIERVIKKIKRENKIGNFKGEFGNGVVLKQLTREYEENGKVLKILADNHENLTRRAQVQNKV